MKFTISGKVDGEEMQVEVESPCTITGNSIDLHCVGKHLVNSGDSTLGPESTSIIFIDGNDEETKSIRAEQSRAHEDGILAHAEEIRARRAFQ